MKILLINSPVRLGANPNCIPYGLSTIASVLANCGHDVEIYDVNALRPNKDEIIVNEARKNIEEMDKVPFPAWDLLSMDVYLRNPIWGDVA